MANRFPRRHELVEDVDTQRARHAQQGGVRVRGSAVEAGPLVEANSFPERRDVAINTQCAAIERKANRSHGSFLEQTACQQYASRILGRSWMAASREGAAAAGDDGGFASLRTGFSGACHSNLGGRPPEGYE